MYSEQRKSENEQREIIPLLMKTKHTFLTITFALSLFSGIAQTLTTSNLPIVILTTTGGDISLATTATMKIVYNGVGQTNNVAGPFNNYNGQIGVKVADFPDRNFQKLSLKIRLQTAGGAANPQSLAGMPSDEDWILHAAYNDKTLMRDALAYKLANKMGIYAPKTKFVEVMIDGLYEGVYTLEETIKPKANRLNITAIQPSSTTGNALTGGYVLKLDYKNDDIGYVWNSSYANGCIAAIDTLQIAYPKAANQQTVQNNYIQQYITNFENGLYANNFDNVTGARKYADLSSFSNYFILSELGKNPDAYRVNTYFYKDLDSNNGKLKMSGVGSYSFALGNAPNLACTAYETEGWSYQDNLSCGTSWGLPMPFWWNKLMEDIQFVDDTRDRWKTLHGTFLVADSINAMIDVMAAELAVPQTRNFDRWSTLLTINDGNFFIPRGNTYAGEISYLKTWLQNRITVLDDQMNTLGHFIQPYSFSKLCGGLDGTLRSFSGFGLLYDWKKGSTPISSDPQIGTDGAGNYSLNVTISGDNPCVITLPSRVVTVIPAGQNATGKSGNWEDATTWTCGDVPVATDRAVLSVGHIVKLSTQVKVIGVDFKQNSQLKYINTTAKVSF